MQAQSPNTGGQGEFVHNRPYASEIVWGIIGCGDGTEVKSGPALQAVPHSRLAVVMRRTAVLAEDYARRHIEIIGSEGRIHLSPSDFIPIVVEQNKRKKHYSRPKPDHVQQFLIENIVAALRGEAEPSPAARALRAPAR